MSITGIGLHTGKAVELTLLPAPPGSGITFERADLPGAPTIPARPEHVVDVHYATTLARDGVQVKTIEHLMAALSGLGVDNLRARLTGPEVPILDGSAAPFVALLKTAGIRRYLLPKVPIRVQRPITVRAGDRWIRIEPAGRLVVEYTMTFGHPKLPAQRVVLTVNRETFVREVAPCRTFGFLRDVQYLWSQGLALGGSLENAVVIGEEGVLNEALRFEDEMIRHKVLDLIG
ncbi:MAG: UDP-3-O-acyl-N-acetylglucosamine deacetylase, partial [candidate division NC10 bacterium]